MDNHLTVLFRQNFFAFARKTVRELEGTRLGDEPYLKFLAKRAQ